jgi:CheY-like chemotaxis protein/predicted  nucleic acid-binding Zn-ribbon protein
MASPVLLVADDLSTIATVKRVLAREGYEAILATSAADALIAWGHHLPGLVVLQPSVETNRGALVLDELEQHPDARLLRVVLLGERLPGKRYTVEPLPLEADHFAATLRHEMRASEPQEWTLNEPQTERALSIVPIRLDEAEPWRLTRISDGSNSEPLQTQPPPVPDDEPPATHFGASPSTVERLFGDLPDLEDELHRDVEAQVIASVESSLPLAPRDSALLRLEDEVRAEAARRRHTREVSTPLAAPPAVQPVLPEPVGASEREAALSPPSAVVFSGFEPRFDELSVDSPVPFVEAPTTLPRSVPDEARAQSVLRRAEVIRQESRAALDAAQIAAAEAWNRRELELKAAQRLSAEAQAVADEERQARTLVETSLAASTENANQLSQKLKTERAEFRHILEEAKKQWNDEHTQFVEQVGALETHIGDLKNELAASSEQRAHLEQRLAETEHALDLSNVTAIERAAERESLLASLAHEQEASRQGEARSASLESEQSRLIATIETLQQQVASLEASLADATSRLETAVQRLHVEATEHRHTQDRLRDAEAAHHATRTMLDSFAERDTQSRDTLSHAENELATLKARLAQLEVDRTDLESELTAAVEAKDHLTQERDRLLETHHTLQAAVADLQHALTSEKATSASLTNDVTAFREGLETQRARADEAEALAQLSTERLKALEHRQVMNLALPGRRALGVPRNGTVTLEQLASLVSTLVATEADVRVELGVQGGTRTLWLRRGSLQGAESTFDRESLIDRARADGLIDARQESDLRLMRRATPSEQLDAMKARGYLREIETIPLLQRATEHIALEAFSEEHTQYRLSDEPPQSTVKLVAVPRATLPLLAEAVRRSVASDVLLERLGGAEAVCVVTESDVDLRALGFSDKERKMVSWVDGEATVEDLTLASGLRQETAFRALLVAKMMGVIDVRPQAATRETPQPEMDIRRLQSKYDEIHDADYFTILGLGRNATTDDVERAYRRLSEEFDPLKYTGHPDASLQQRAQVVSALLEEAAKALEDDRRRLEYARHLLD